MGNYLNTPDNSKQTISGLTPRVSYGVCSMRGWRMRLEDAHVTYTSFPRTCKRCKKELPLEMAGSGVPVEELALFAIFDGHGGPHVARFAASNIIQTLQESSKFMTRQYAEALRESFTTIDRKLLSGDEAVSRQLELFMNQQAIMPRGRRQSVQYRSVQPNPSSANAVLEVLDDTLSNSSASLELVESNRCACIFPTVHDESGDFPMDIQSLASAPDALDSTKQLTLIPSLASSAASVFVPQPHEGISSPGSSSPATGSPPASPPPSRRRQSTGSSTSPEPSVKHNWRKRASVAVRMGSRRSHSKKKPPQDLEEQVTPRVERPFEGSVESQSSSAQSSIQSFFSNAVRGVRDVFGTLGRPATVITAGNGQKAVDRGGCLVGIDSAGKTVPLKGCQLAMLAGSTAVAVLISSTEIFVANSGDSRCVLCRGSTAVDLSHDHKPQLPEEKNRIINAGGFLEMGRVNGNLNLSRALGDLIYKQNKDLPQSKQIITSYADVTTTTIDVDNDEFLIIGCDGIWEYFTSQDIVDFIRDRLVSVLDTSAEVVSVDPLYAATTESSRLASSATYPPQHLCIILDELFETLLSPNPSLFEYGCDNMTAVLVDLKPNTRRGVRVKRHRRDDSSVVRSASRGSPPDSARRLGSGDNNHSNPPTSSKLPNSARRISQD